MATSPFLGGFTATAFSNDYLLKHGNFFMKPALHADGFLYPALSEAARYQVYRDALLVPPLKQEKPPTPPDSASPGSPTPPDITQMLNGSSKSTTWILGKQKLSWDNSTVASYNPDTKMFRCVVCNAVGFLSRIAEHYLGTHTSAKVFQCLHCPYSSTWSRCVRMHMAKHHGVPNAPPSLWKGQPLLEEIFQLLTNLKTTVDSQGRDRLDPEISDKKFVCPKCPYTTDRRDLYLRHENIHKEDKPYHCYICFKLFNRADHVKKHFLRIHRGHPYDISLVRRRPPKCAPVDSSQKGNSNNFTVDKLIAEVLKEEPEDGEVIDLSQRRSPSPGHAHDEKGPKTFRCPHCEWEGVDGWCLRRHMNVHLKTFQCPSCEFKTAKAERLFTHVYRSHKKLICTKCKYVTDMAQEFEVHIKDCCLEMVVGSLFEKISEDSPTESDDAGPELDISALDIKPQDMVLDLRSSVSLMPLHNSISYCYPGPVTDTKPRSENVLKPELASPVQSSSDSGIADVTGGEQDYACLHCGCEFADAGSLHTHADLHHRPELQQPAARPRRRTFCCVICDFYSHRQRAIIEHMRCHSGEVLPCRAGGACTYTSTSDSALEEHVRSSHTDSVRRCPHCAVPCNGKVPFIRHYRRCHHSRSCRQCRAVRRSFDQVPSATNQTGTVRPYLHHNPYSKKGNGILPYAHCNAAMSKVAVAIPPSLQAIADGHALFEDRNQREKKSRKQSSPRKLRLAKRDKGLKRSTTKRTSLPLRRCHVGHAKPVSFRCHSNFARHQMWQHHTRKHNCRKCLARFVHAYQALLHMRKEHE